MPIVWVYFKLQASRVIQRELSDLGTITPQDTKWAGSFGGCFLIAPSLIINESITLLP